MLGNDAAVWHGDQPGYGEANAPAAGDKYRICHAEHARPRSLQRWLRPVHWCRIPHCGRKRCELSGRECLASPLRLPHTGYRAGPAVLRPDSARLFRYRNFALFYAGRQEHRHARRQPLQQRMDCSFITTTWTIRSGRPMPQFRSEGPVPRRLLRDANSPTTT